MTAANSQLGAAIRGSEPQVSGTCLSVQSRHVASETESPQQPSSVAAPGVVVSVVDLSAEKSLLYLQAGTNFMQRPPQPEAVSLFAYSKLHTDLQ